MLIPTKKQMSKEEAIEHYLHLAALAEKRVREYPDQPAFKDLVERQLGMAIRLEESPMEVFTVQVLVRQEDY